MFRSRARRRHSLRRLPSIVRSPSQTFFRDGRSAGSHRLLDNLGNKGTNDKPTSKKNQAPTKHDGRFRCSSHSNVLVSRLMIHHAPSVKQKCLRITVSDSSAFLVAQHGEPSAPFVLFQSEGTLLEGVRRGNLPSFRNSALYVVVRATLPDG